MKRLYKMLFDRIISKTPECFQSLRSFFVRKFIRSAGKHLSIGRKCKIHKNTSMGDHSGVGFGCEINNSVSIGSHVMMGPNVLIYTQNHRTDDPDISMDRQGMAELRPVFIEDDVWIGARVIILPGVTIGTGSVVGAGAVVAKSIPPYSVAVGNPARVVKSRKNADAQ